MKVPFFGKDRYYQEHKKDILEIVDEVYSTGQVLQGSQVKEFEKNIAGCCGREFAVAVGSCTDALHFSLLNEGVGHGDEVLVPGFTFIASASCIPKVGAIPVFVDILDGNYMMDLYDFEDKITDKTKAVIGVHLFGNSLNINDLEKITKQHNLVLIEDAAQSIGSYFDDRKVGSVGKYSCISFDPTKLLSAQSNAGVLLTDDSCAYERISQLRYHGKNLTTDEFETIGYNSRVSSLQAALLDFNLSHLNKWIMRNQEISEKYRRGLEGIGDIILPKEFSHINHVYHKYVIQTNKRNKLKSFLESESVQAKIHYGKSLPEHGLFKNYKHRAEGLDVIDKVKNKVLSLPIHPWLKNEEVNFVVEKIKEFYN